MKEEIIQKLAAVIAALDTLTVSGQNNLGNLYGSIIALKDIVRDLTTDDKTAIE